MFSDPLAYFITWTVYGTFLPGDTRGWMQREHGKRDAAPSLDDWHRERLKHPIVMLDEKARQCVQVAMRELCVERGWKLWVANARSNHVHGVITSCGYTGNLVRDQLKARSTRDLRALDQKFKDRPVWTRGGDWKSLWKEGDVESAILYAGEVQDRKGRE